MTASTDRIRRDQAATAVRIFEARSGRKVTCFDAYADRIDVATSDGHRLSISYDGYKVRW